MVLDYVRLRYIEDRIAFRPNAARMVGLCLGQSRMAALRRKDKLPTIDPPPIRCPQLWQDCVGLPKHVREVHLAAARASRVRL